MNNQMFSIKLFPKLIDEALRNRRNSLLPITPPYRDVITSARESLTIVTIPKTWKAHTATLLYD